MDRQGMIDTILAVCDKIASKEHELTMIDNYIADGDHGVNMARGFMAVKEKITGLHGEETISDIMRTIGMTLISSIGGSAGPLFGTIFLKSGAVLSGANEITISDFLLCINNAIEGIKLLGHAKQGDKTMLDSMIPSYTTMKELYDSNNYSTSIILESGVKSAWAGVESTKTYAATRGRASYIGDRSIGHQDAGATSYAYILESIYDSFINLQK